MPNDAVFDYPNRPVYTQETNTYKMPGTWAPPDADAAVNGREFIVNASNSQSLGILGGSVTITLQLANPSNSGRTIYISRIMGGTGVSLSLLSSFSATLALTKGATLTSPSSATPFNTNFSSSNLSSIASSSQSAAGGGTPFVTLPLTAGQFVYEQRGGLVVPPNQTFALTVAASLSVLGVLSSYASIAWWEG